MSEFEPILCPECGWSGESDELVKSDGDYECPVCAEAMQFVE